MNTYRRPAGHVAVTADHAGRRLDKFLRSHLKGVPAGLIFRLLRKGAVRVDDRRARPDHRLAAGELIFLPAMDLPPPAAADVPAPVRKAVAGAIVHESRDLLVIDKPADLAVHAGTGVRAGVIEALRELRPGEDLELAHRIDLDTSGLLMVARRPQMLRHLQSALRDGRIERGYLALVRGTVAEPMRIDAPVPTEDGPRDALTLIRPVRQVGPHATLIRAQLITGRKHQIRLHTAHTGHPIAGDTRHGDARFTALVRQRGGHRMFLHAHSLRIPLPGGDTLELTAPAPPAWDRTLERLQTPGGRRRHR